MTTSNRPSGEIAGVLDVSRMNNRRYGNNAAAERGVRKPSQLTTPGRTFNTFGRSVVCVTGAMISTTPQTDYQPAGVGVVTLVQV